MGNHRADRRGSGRPHSGTPVTTERAAAPAGGRRKADPKAERRALRETQRETQREAQREAQRQTPRESQRQVARRHTGSRKQLFRALPSAPVLAGVAALAVSAGGAVAAGDPALTGTDAPRISQAGALTGSSQVSSSDLLKARGAAISRDSRRDALSEAADDKLVAAAEDQAQQRDAALAKFAKQAEQQAAKLKLNQWVLPVAGYHLTARFGESSGLWSTVHTGLDFAAPSGTPIQAVANGVVTSVGYDGSYGNKTVVTLDDGTELWFCHQTSYAVSVGQEVSAGDLIGYVGSTGNVTGPHLHLEVRPGGGDPVDPYQALIVHGLQP